MNFRVFFSCCCCCCLNSFLDIYGLIFLPGFVLKSPKIRFYYLCDYLVVVVIAVAAIVIIVVIVINGTPRFGFGLVFAWFDLVLAST